MGLNIDKVDFSNVEPAALLLRREDANTAFALLMGEDRTTGRMPLAPAAALKTEERAKKIREEQQHEFLFAQLTRHLEDLRAQREALYQRLEDIGRERDEIREASDALNEERDALQGLRSGAFERNADGSLKDERLEALIVAHEAQTGQKIDRQNREALQAILLRRLAEIEREQTALREREERLRREAGDITTRIETLDRKIESAQETLGQRGSPEFEARAQANLNASTQDVQDDITASLQRAAGQPAQSNRAGFQFSG